MDHREAIDYIHNTYRFGSKLGLENIRRLLDRLGNPHEGLQVLHVAGTNGKGSTCAFLSAVLAEAGYKVGLYTSPYLEVFNERIQINGTPIEDGKLAALTTRVKTEVDALVSEGHAHPTEFEIVTAIAFCHFQAEAVDFLVLEVGMGGRLDATNVVGSPLVSIITPLSMEHTEHLGNTLAAIAREKGGIIKAGGLVVSSTQPREAEEVLEAICRERGARLEKVKTYNYRIVRRSLESYEFKSMALRFFKNIRIGLVGEHQIRNCILATRALECLIAEGRLEIEEKDMLAGLEKTRWPGRLESMPGKPAVIIDGAHNLQGASILRNFMQYHLSGKKMRDRRLIGVAGILKDKDAGAMLAETAPLFDELIVTEPPNERALKAKALKAAAGAYCDSVEEIPDWRRAVEAALEKAGEEGVVMVFGSLYLAGSVRSVLKNR